MLKNTKKVFSLILAIAVVAMSMFTGVVVSAADPVETAHGNVDLLEFGDYLINDLGSTSKYYDNKLADNGETGADWDNAIIIDSAEEFVYLCKASGDDTKGKYYKVADGIAGFNLATDKLDIDGTLAGASLAEGMTNMDVIKAAGKNHSGGTPGFQGHFDGNGATVYGAWTNHNEGYVSNYTGLFSCTKGEVTIKNIHVKMAHFTAKNAVGGIIGYHAATDMCTVTIENCSVTDSYLETQGTGWGTGIGAILGYGASAPALREANDQKDYNGDGDMTDTIYINVAYNIKNCYVNLDEENFVSPGEDGVVSEGERVCHGGVAGVSGSNALSVSECVVIGIKPYATSESTGFNDVQHSGLESHFSNVYTTSDVAITEVNIGGNGGLGIRNFTGKVFPLSNAQLKGSAAVVAMSGLDWGTTWVMDGTDTYPRLALPGEKFDTIYWDGTNTKTAPTQGSGTKADPYIISTVAELAYISGQARDNYAITDGKYYKIADGIKSIVMQPYAYGNDIKALDSAAATKAYFEANASNMKQWLYYGWEGSTFCGNIDFNGATVYGIYQISSSNAGLFSNIDAGATFHNLAIKNSYMVSQSSGANYQCGALGAVTNGGTYGKSVNGFIWAKNIEIANNYMYNNSTSHDRSGVMFGASSDIMYVDNALIYGNDATYGSDVPMPLYSSANNNVLVSSAPAIPEGLVVVDDGAETPRYYNMTRNSIFLGFNPFDLPQGYGSRVNDLKGYQNCYTDADVETATDKNGKTLLQYFYVDTTTPYITQINASEITGGEAQTNMPDLTWGTDWYCGAYGKLPTLATFTTLGVNETSTAAHRLYGSSVTYNNDGTFDFNLHFVPQFEGIKATLYVGTYDATKFYKLESTESSYRDELGEGALMFTLKNISARDIDKIWMPTIVVEGGASVEWGLTQPVALVDNAKAVLEGNYDTADKKVSAALINYGSTAKAALAETTNNYSAGTIDLLEFGDYLINDLGSTSKWYDNKLADNGETGADWANAIIIDSAEEFVYLAKAANNETAGKYYKVADGIAGFDLSKGDLDFDGTLAANLEKIKNGGKNHSGGTPGFQGHFDGNGATVYGAWINGGNYAGLFPCASGTVTIKNLNVKLSYFKATTAAGGLIGYYAGAGTGTLTVENCSVTDCYIESTSTGGYGHGIGAIYGYAHNYGSSTNGPIYVTNCFINLDEQYFITADEAEDFVAPATNGVVHGGIGGYAVTNQGMVSNCIVLGVKPYSTYKSTGDNQHQHTNDPGRFQNVYTDAATGTVTVGGKLQTRNFTGKIFQLTEEQLTGVNAKANMPSLDWNNVWTTTNGYPTFISKDYEAPASGVVATWDGTVATGFASGNGTEENPYIISTAAEFAYMVKDNASYTPDKYFKVADGISAFVMQKPEYASDIMALGSAADTKAYFEENAANMLKWPNYGWEGSSFCGHFDGNGATVYGLYQPSTNNAGLFSSVDAGAAIQNIGVQNSYLTSSATNYQVAAIAPVANGTGYGVKAEGVVWVNGCTVANNYMYNACTSWERSGVISGGFSNDIIMIDNCLVYGNDATYGSDVKMALTGVGNNDVETTAKKPAELPSYVENSSFYCNTVRNSIILDCDAMNTKGGRSYRRNAPNCFVNVYTNAASGTVTLSNGDWTYEDAEIKAITPDEVKGSAATSIVETLNAAPIGDIVWYVGATGDYPGFKEAGSMPSAFQTALNGITFDTADTLGDGVEYHANGTMAFGVYQTALSLKANPYMSFAFAFLGDYRTNREKIKVRFTYTENGELKTSEEISVPAYTGEDIKDVSGWTNTERNGRYHTFKAESIPVEALASPIKVEASYNGGAWKDFGSFSVEGLGVQFENASKVTPSDYYTTRVEATKALLFYAQAIQARYSAQ